MGMTMINKDDLLAKFECDRCGKIYTLTKQNFHNDPSDFKVRTIYPRDGDNVCGSVLLCSDECERLYKEQHPGNYWKQGQSI